MATAAPSASTASDAITTAPLPITLQPPYLASWKKYYAYPKADIFWYAETWNPNRGEIVMQLGTKQTPSNGVLYRGEYRLGFTYHFTATREGYHEFKAFIDAGPVTINHGTGAVVATLEVLGPDGKPVSTPPLSRISATSPQHYELTAGDDLSLNQQYSFAMYGKIVIFFYGGGNAYSEIIARFPKAELLRPRPIIEPPTTGLAMAAAPRKGGEQTLQARLDKALREHGSLEKAVAALGLKVEESDVQVMEREFSLEETLKAGPNGFWSFQA